MRTSTGKNGFGNITLPILSEKQISLVKKLPEVLPPPVCPWVETYSSWISKHVKLYDKNSRTFIMRDYKTKYRTYVDYPAARLEEHTLLIEGVNEKFNKITIFVKNPNDDQDEIDKVAKEIIYPPYGAKNGITLLGDILVAGMFRDNLFFALRRLKVHNHNRLSDDELSTLHLWLRNIFKT